MKTASASECCEAFLQWISRYGCPATVVSDNGNSFVSNLYSDITKVFNIKVSYTPAYHAQTNGLLERAHQTFKNGLKAALIDMGNEHRDKWMQALPWVLLGKRVQYQPHLDASASQLVLGKAVKIPGQLLGQPGPALNTAQTRQLLDQLYKLASRPPVETSSPVDKKGIDHTLSATHVYVKQANPQSLCPKFEGPYEIVSRPSRSTIQVKIGAYANGESRLLTLNWSSCKVAHMRDGAEPSSRPNLGRRPGQSGMTSPSHGPTQTDRHLEFPQPPTDAVNPVFPSNHNNSDAGGSGSSNQNKNQGAKIQTRYPSRSTRNSNPVYN